MAGYSSPRSPRNEDSALIPPEPACWTSGPAENHELRMDASELRRELEVQRSSAEYYLDQYLDYLSQSCVELDDHVSQDLSTDTHPGSNRVEIRRNISRDSAIRDLHAIETLLAYAKTLAESQKPGYSLTAATWTVGCCVTVATVTAKAATIASSVGAAVGAAQLTGPKLWHAYKAYKIDTARTRVRELREAFENNTVDDTYKDTLKPSQFTFVS